MSKTLAFAGVLVLGAIAALMVATNNSAAPAVTLDQVTIKRDMFAQWKLAHAKTYSSSAEEETRFTAWSANYDWVQAHNMIPENTYTVGMTVFADLTQQEFAALNSGCTFDKIVPGTSNDSHSVGANPTSVDWRTNGAVTPVKNQGQCGSCWAFSTTGALEGLNAIKKGSLVSFSEQQLVDCSGSYGNMGCNGGLMDYAFQYVAAKGIEPESVYPYTAKQGTCKYSATATVFKNTGFTDVPSKNNAALETAVAQQPVSVAIEADQSVFQLYTSGVLNSASCGTSLDHGVLAVGYGTTSAGQAHWIVKNSWGTSWGEQGYVRLAKVATSGAGICGIALQPSYPTLSAAESKPKSSKSPKSHEHGETEN